MAEDNFNQRKKDVLGKVDKSHEGKLDNHILKLCQKINKKENYYATSSCSGRVLLMIDQEKKGAGLFLWKSHKKIKFLELKKELKKISGKKKVKFKCEPPILHVVCKNLENAKNILEKGIKFGWKKSGLISLGKNIVVELHGTEKFEFPILENGKILVNDGFLKLIVDKSNKKIEKGWERINILEKSI